MTEKKDENEVTIPEKLLIDNPRNFKFHAAYLAYAEIFEKIIDFKIKRELNKNIEDLKEKKINYSKFYRNITRYRVSATQYQNQGRFSLKTQRKRDWRRATQKKERIKRHKK